MPRTKRIQDKGSHRSNKAVLVLAPPPFLFLLFLQVKKIKRRTPHQENIGLDT
jgi:hypothetical protein